MLTSNFYFYCLFIKSLMSSQISDFYTIKHWLFNYGWFYKEFFDEVARSIKFIVFIRYFRVILKKFRDIYTGGGEKFEEFRRVFDRDKVQSEISWSRNRCKMKIKKTEKCEAYLRSLHIKFDLKSSDRAAENVFRDFYMRLIYVFVLHTHLWSFV